MSLCTHLDSHICQPQPLLPFLLPRFDTSAFLAACFSSYACPSILTIMLNNQTGTVAHGLEVGGQTGKEAGWGWERGGHIWMPTPVVFLHAWTRTSLTRPSPFHSPPTFFWLYHFPLKLVFLTHAWFISYLSSFSLEYYSDLFTFSLKPLQLLSIPLPK